MFAAHTSAGRSSSSQYWIVPLLSPGPAAVGTHGGRCFGHRFSKNDPPSTPSGKRLNVSALSRMCGSIVGAIRV